MNPERYSMYRANVPRRRTLYKAFIGVAIAVFVASLVDILFLDSVLYYGVLAAYAILFIWAIIMLISSKIRESWKVGEVILNCPSCKNSFLYGADHADNDGHASMSCPICAKVSALPVSREQVAPARLGDGARYEHAFSCSSCEEHIVITTMGNDGKDVHFDACPHCGEFGTVGEAAAPREVVRKKLPFWSTA